MLLGRENNKGGKEVVSEKIGKRNKNGIMQIVKKKSNDGDNSDAVHAKQETGETRRERLAKLREEKTQQVRNEYKLAKEKRKREAEEREVKRLKALHESAR